MGRRSRDGQHGAILYAVIGLYRHRGIARYAYLRDVHTRLPTMTHHQCVDIPAAWTTPAIAQDRFWA